jgi:predicted TIM-barrel fold metal-dependent hydrolase
MTDSHIHIGQFEDVYYDPLEIINIVMSSGMEGLTFSSTSSGRDDVLYSTIEKEIDTLLSGASYSPDIIRPLLWYIPDYIRQHITVESAFNSIPYKGIKLHPYMNDWDFNDTQQMDILHSLFDYAARKKLPILIHTGESGVDAPNRFEPFISEYSAVKCILAHSRPVKETVEMLRKYRNAFCDTAFAPTVDIREIASLGFADRIIFGSDFPVTHFFKTKYPEPWDIPPFSLKEQYIRDVADWKTLENELGIGK